MKQIKPILAFVWSRKSSVVAFTIFNLLSVMFSMVSLALLIPFLNLLFGKEELITTNPGFSFTYNGIGNYFKYILSDVVIRHQDNKLWALGLICILVLVAIILKNTFVFLSRYTLHPLRNDISRSIKADMYQKILRLPIGFFSNEKKGDVLSRLTTDVREVEDSVISTMDLIFSVPLTILFYLIFMISVSVQLCLFLFLLLPLGGLLIGRVSKSLKKQSTDNSQRIGSLLSIVEETLGGLRIVKAFAAEKTQETKFNKENNYLNRLNNSIAKKRELASPLSETLAIVILCIILMYGGKLVLQDKTIEAGTFIMFILVFTQLIDPLKKFSQIFYNIQKGNASLDRINLIANAENTIQEDAHPIELTEFKESIQLKNVCFNYGERQVLKNINLTIKKGTTVALVGASGSGKSTLVDLLPRFHDIASGEILVDSIPLTKFSIASVRSHIGMVSQEPILFNDTIAENIALGNESVDNNKVEQAAKVANAHAFIMTKASGYDTNVGDRGNQLSGGEKQRLTIARAVYKNPAILILDEATSSLDTESEKLVQDAIHHLTQNRTSIIIAHRLSTVVHADKIVVLHQGEIVEEGTHQELLQRGGYYKKLVEMQALNN